MSRVAKYRSSMNAKAALGRKSTKESGNKNVFISNGNKKEFIDTLLKGSTKNSR